MQYPPMKFKSCKSENKQLKSILHALVKLCVDHRFKPHVPPFEQIPANSVKFQSCDCTPQVEYFRVNLLLFLKKSNIHLLRCRLIGIQLLFDNYTLMHQRQFLSARYLHL